MTGMLLSDWLYGPISSAIPPEDCAMEIERELSEIENEMEAMRERVNDLEECEDDANRLRTALDRLISACEQSGIERVPGDPNSIKIGNLAISLGRGPGPLRKASDMASAVREAKGALEGVD